MIFTLQRYIFRELLRIFLLATVALTLVVSLGGILRPVQEFGVAPRQVVDILSYFIPISLTFVLPVAALFAAALAYGRFASDNELDACRASGVSMLTLVYPGFVLALLVAIANLLLSFHVVPSFVHLAEKLVQADAKQILFHSIQRRGYYNVSVDRGAYFIYADHADIPNDALVGIIVVQYEGGRLRRLVCAQSAKVEFESHGEHNVVRLIVSQAKEFGDVVNDDWGEGGQMVLRAEFNSLLEDEIKFKKIEQMKQIETNLMSFEPIASKARQAYRQLLTELMGQEVAKAIEPAGGFYELTSPSLTLKISARSCTLPHARMIELQAPVIVKEYDAQTGQFLRQMESEKNALLGSEEEVWPIRWVLELSDAKVEETGQIIFHDTVGNLALPAALAERLGSDGPLSLTMPERSSELLGNAPSSILAKLQKPLLQEIRHARVHIQSEIHSRLIFGIGCLPMILIGIGWGILRREGHLLSAFGASCIPATILGVAILCGKQVAERVDSMVLTGILIMWGGLAFLLLLTILTYRRLLRQ